MFLRQIGLTVWKKTLLKVIGHNKATFGICIGTCIYMWQ